MLPNKDLTPPDYVLPTLDANEWLKRPIRRFIYPILNRIISHRLASQFAAEDFKPDLWLWGQRGNDYERHRRRVNSLSSLQGANILIAGCGTGRDLESWVKMNPARILAIDWFRYDRAWLQWRERFESIAPDTKVQFVQANLTNLLDVQDASVEMVGSDAVFEHLQNLPAALTEFHRVLRPGGIIYATFGPLWFGWGGDHVSGYDGVESGFNHLVLERDEWLRYVNTLESFGHSEHDGRTWIEHDLFSRLKPTEYLSHITAAGFRCIFVSAIIDPRAAKALRSSASLRNLLLKKHLLRDLLVCGMTVIARRI